MLYFLGAFYLLVVKLAIVNIVEEYIGGFTIITYMLPEKIFLPCVAIVVELGFAIRSSGISMTVTYLLILRWQLHIQNLLALFGEN